MAMNYPVAAEGIYIHDSNGELIATASDRLHAARIAAALNACSHLPDSALPRRVEARRTHYVTRHVYVGGLPDPSDWLGTDYFVIQTKPPRLGRYSRTTLDGSETWQAVAAGEYPGEIEARRAITDTLGSGAFWTFTPALGAFDDDGVVAMIPTGR